MSDFITLACPTCGGNLEITNDIERFACAHCGKEHIVKRGGGIISLTPVLENVSKGVDNTVSELALVRLEKEIGEIKPLLSDAKAEAERYQEEAQRRIPAIIGTIVLILGGVLIFVLTDLTLLAMIVLLVGIVLIGYTYYLHSKEFKDSLQEAIVCAENMQERYEKVKEDYDFHHGRANRR